MGVSQGAGWREDEALVRYNEGMPLYLEDISKVGGWGGGLRRWNLGW